MTSRGASAETFPNHSAPSGVTASTPRAADVAKARRRVNARSAGALPGRSSMATTTSLRPKHTLRSVNTSPMITGHAASESMACGMRLIAALVSGIARNMSTGVSMSGM